MEIFSLCTLISKIEEIREKPNLEFECDFILIYFLLSIYLILTIFSPYFEHHHRDAMESFSEASEGINKRK